MTPKQATAILAADTPEAAGARTIIKRAMRSFGLVSPDDPAALAAWFRKTPWAAGREIERRIEASNRAWERSDSNKEHLYASHVETLMSLIGVALTWPWLYPTYKFSNHDPNGPQVVEVYELSALWRDSCR